MSSNDAAASPAPPTIPANIPGVPPIPSGPPKPAPVNGGGVTDKYVWTQRLPELTVHIPVPSR